MGVIFGAIIVNSMTISQKEDLYYYLSQFFGQLSDGKQASSAEMFVQSIFHNAKYLGLMWILGNFRHWDADYFHYDLSERDRRRLYCRVPSQSDGSKRVFPIICLRFAAKCAADSGLLDHGHMCNCVFFKVNQTAVRETKPA